MLTIEQVRSLYHNDSAHDFDHVLRVLANAEQIGRVEGANMDVLRTATLLHDIARADQERTGQMAQRRHRFMVQFFEQMAEEIEEA